MASSEVSAARKRFGTLQIEGDRVTDCVEKPVGDGGWINAGFFVLSPKVTDYIEGDDTIWERRPMEQLARNRQLAVYHHRTFWQPMDTLRDKTMLDNLWNSGQAPWKTWKVATVFPSRRRAMITSRSSPGKRNLPFM